MCKVFSVSYYSGIRYLLVLPDGVPLDVIIVACSDLAKHELSNLHSKYCVGTVFRT